MGRFVAGVASALFLMAAGAFIFRSISQTPSGLPAAPAQSTSPLAVADVSPPVEASEKTREEKRFSRYDKDKNGAVSRSEYLLSRQKAYAKLDLNGDGTLSFEEYAVKTSQKFAKADRDRTGVLTPVEFATTRVVRKAQSRKNCPPVRAPLSADSGEET